MALAKKYITWYVLRTKQYIAAFPSTSVREHSPKHVEGYVISKANDNQLKDWQFTQIVDAIKILFSLGLKSDWAQDYDWEGIVSFHAPEDAKSLSTDDVRVYLEYLAIQRNVAVATQKQALEEVRRVLDQLGEKHVMNTPGMAVQSPADLI